MMTLAQIPASQEYRLDTLMPAEYELARATRDQSSPSQHADVHVVPFQYGFSRSSSSDWGKPHWFSSKCQPHPIPTKRTFRPKTSRRDPTNFWKTDAPHGSMKKAPLRSSPKC